MKIVDKIMETGNLFRTEQKIQLNRLNKFEDDLLFDLAVTANDEGSYLKLASFGESVVRGLTKACCKYGRPVSCMVTDERRISESEIRPATIAVDFQNRKNIVFVDEVRNPETEFHFHLHHGADGVVASIERLGEMDRLIHCIVQKDNPSVGYAVHHHTNNATKVYLNDISWFILPCGDSVSKNAMMDYCIHAKALIYAISCNIFLTKLHEKEKGDGFSMIRQITDLYQIGLYEDDACMIHSMKIIMTGFASGYIHTDGRYDIPEIATLFHALQNMHSYSVFMVHEHSSAGFYYINMDSYEVTYCGTTLKKQTM